MPALKHEVQGGIAERAVAALERIADALEESVQLTTERRHLEAWPEQGAGVR